MGCGSSVQSGQLSEEVDRLRKEVDRLAKVDSLRNDVGHNNQQLAQAGNLRQEGDEKNKQVAEIASLRKELDQKNSQLAEKDKCIQQFRENLQKFDKPATFDCHLSSGTPLMEVSLSVTLPVSTLLDRVRQECASNPNLGFTSRNTVTLLLGNQQLDDASKTLREYGVEPESNVAVMVAIVDLQMPSAGCFVIKGGTFTDDDPRLVLPKSVTLAGKCFTFQVRLRRQSVNKVAPLFAQLPTDNVAGGPGTYRLDTLPFAYLGSTASGWPGLRFGFWGDDLTIGDRNRVCQPSDERQYVQWTFTYNATTQTRKAFRDGQHLGTDRARGNPQPQGPIMLGHMSDGQRAAVGYSAKLVGSMKDLFIWDVELSDEQVRRSVEGWDSLNQEWAEPLIGHLIAYSDGELTLTRGDGGGAWEPPGYGHGGRKMD